MHTKFIRSIVAIAVISSPIFALPSVLFAQAYGDGTYGGGNYNTGQTFQEADRQENAAQANPHDGSPLPSTIPGSSPSGTAQRDGANEGEIDAESGNSVHDLSDRTPRPDDHAVLPVLGETARLGLGTGATVGAVAVTLLVIIGGIVRRRRSQ